MPKGNVIVVFLEKTVKNVVTFLCVFLGWPGGGGGCLC
jgi:hypothetical protein